jgi:hypothetical protein
LLLRAEDGECARRARYRQSKDQIRSDQASRSRIKPGANPLLNLVADWYGLPIDGVRGGSQTLYPEYLDGLELPGDRPLVCTQYCSCAQDNSPACDSF